MAGKWGAAASLVVDSDDIIAKNLAVSPFVVGDRLFGLPCCCRTCRATIGRANLEKESQHGTSSV